MTTTKLFRSTRLTGHPPSDEATRIYQTLFDEEGAEWRLQRDKMDWARHNVAPWVLHHAGAAVGVGGFRIGFGAEGLELSFHFLPEFWGQGLASEFVQAALDHATLCFREDRFFAVAGVKNTASIRVLEKAGFQKYGCDDVSCLLRLNLSETPVQPLDQAG